MAEKAQLKTIQCPTCGAGLKTDNFNAPLECVHCGNTFVPMENTRSTEAPPAFSGGAVRVSGMQTPSSVLAYLDEFFETYDWEAFGYAQALTIAEIDRAAASLRTTCADDHCTWQVCFQAVSVPFLRKVDSCKNLLSSIVADYRQDNLDAYSTFDAYKRISTALTDNRDDVVSKLEKLAANAAKYGIEAQDHQALLTQLDAIRAVSLPLVYAQLSDIPQVQEYDREKNARIVETLSAQGINANAQYQQAKSLIAQQQYVGALTLLLPLKGYNDTDKLIEQLDKYFLLDDVLEIDGRLYYFSKSSPEQQTLNLHPTAEGKILGKPLITDINQILTNYADLLYYLDARNRLVRFDLAAKTKTVLSKNHFDASTVFSYNRTLIMTSTSADYDGSKNLVSLNLATGQVDIIADKIKDMVRREGNKLVYTKRKKVGLLPRLFTYIFNLDTHTTTELAMKKPEIHGFVENHVVFSVDSGRKNRNLFIKELDSQKPAQCIERNILSFCDITAGKLFYYVGSPRARYLIVTNWDGSNRIQWPMYISEILFEQGGWLYYTRKVGYNAILCKARLDGTDRKVIAADIDTFVKIKNGYLYYINDETTLCRVRMDGSNLQELCDGVETVLSVKEDKIIFVSIDEKVSLGEFGGTQLIHSIYAVEFDGSGIRKLANDITKVKAYDDNTIYYTTAVSMDEQADDGSTETIIKNFLLRLNAETYISAPLLELKVQPVEDASSGFVGSMILMCIGLIVAFIGMFTNNGILTFLGFIGAVVFLIAGLSFMKKKGLSS